MCRSFVYEYVSTKYTRRINEIHVAQNFVHATCIMWYIIRGNQAISLWKFVGICMEVAERVADDT